MGYILNASCEHCGFNKKVYFGGGMQNVRTVCNVPAINKKTGEFVEKNYLQYLEVKKRGNIKELEEWDYIFYTESEMSEDSDKHNKFTFGDIGINSNKNYCPQCKNFSLNFRGIGLFD